MNAELHDYELRRSHSTPVTDPEARIRSDLTSGRRQARRHRLAEHVRSVADRLDV